jgi:hypothetical protein
MTSGGMRHCQAVYADVTVKKQKDTNMTDLPECGDRWVWLNGQMLITRCRHPMPARWSVC